MNPPRSAWRLLAVLLLTLLPMSACLAESMQFCDPQQKMTVGQQDRLLRFGGIVKRELQASGQRVALIARSGLDLSWFGNLRYSHAGVALRDSPNAPWSIRQLYFACDQRRPLIFDQGMAGFVLGADDPDVGYVSVVLLPTGVSDLTERVVADDRLALALLSRTYSANAYPYSPLYQNCNQWVIELLATAWGRLADGTAEGAAVGTAVGSGRGAVGAEIGPGVAVPAAAGVATGITADDAKRGSGSAGDVDLRERAQQWLKADGYRPMVFEIHNPLIMVAGAFVPWVHTTDHPPDDVADMMIRVSMPASIDAFVRAAVPQARRIEFCYNRQEVVIHRGWTPVADGCHAGDGDTVVPLR